MEAEAEAGIATVPGSIIELQYPTNLDTDTSSFKDKKSVSSRWKPLVDYRCMCWLTRSGYNCEYIKSGPNIYLTCP